MVLSLAINITPPSFSTSTYWLLHGILFIMSCVVIYLLGKNLFINTINSIKQCSIKIETLFAITSCGAMLGSIISTITGDTAIYYEVVAIVLIVYSIGKNINENSFFKIIFEIQKTKENFSTTTIQQFSGKKEKIPIKNLSYNDIILIYPGEPIAIDGIITEGIGYIYETIINGKVEPVKKKTGDIIYAGSYSIDATFKVQLISLSHKRYLDFILKTIESAPLSSESILQKQANQIIKFFVPVIIITALCTFLYWSFYVKWTSALFNSMAVILVACPCSLGLATPFAIWNGLWHFSSFGLIARTGRFIDVLASVNVIIFDKTGTLSLEKLKVIQFVLLPSFEKKRDYIIHVIHSLEEGSYHPVARALLSLELKENISSPFTLKKLYTIPGKGIVALIKNHQTFVLYKIYLGDFSLFSKKIQKKFMKIDKSFLNIKKKIIFLSINKKPAAYFVLNEEFRAEIPAVISQIKKLDIKLFILTGDTSVVNFTSINNANFYQGITPHEKVKFIYKNINTNNTVLFVGDGLNDAPALAVAQASIAMSNGPALISSTAMATLKKEESLCAIPQAISISRKIRKCIIKNLIFAIIYNCIGMSFAATGILHPIVAALLMVLSSATVLIHAGWSVK